MVEDPIGKVEGNTEVAISGAQRMDNVYGGSEYAVVTGKKTTIDNHKRNRLVGSVYGGLSGRSAGKRFVIRWCYG